MHTYKVFRHPAKRDIKAVKQGWSWPGFFFDLIWVFIKRMWFIGLVVFGFFFMLGFIQGIYANEPEVSSNILSLINASTIGIKVLLGWKGNSYYADALETRGYQLIGVVDAANPDAATAKVIVKDNQEIRNED